MAFSGGSRACRGPIRNPDCKHDCICLEYAVEWYQEDMKHLTKIIEAGNKFIDNSSEALKFLHLRIEQLEEEARRDNEVIARMAKAKINVAS